VFGKERRSVPLDKYALAGQIRDLLEDDLTAAGFDLLDVRIFRGGGRVQVRVYVDADQGVNLDDCARASRTVDMLLEEAGIIEGRYVIEVSSPGIRRPLRRPEHFAAGIGQEILVSTGSAARPRRIKGRLVAADETGISIEPRGEDAAGVVLPVDGITLDYADILEANLEPDFDVQGLIRADRRRRKEAERQDRQERRKRRQNKSRRRPKP
jgi:ribosome maturation factor RimP